ncbi:hypothetical protein BH10PSE13_BH10PSE13_24220 [soil metagenome]
MGASFDVKLIYPEEIDHDLSRSALRNLFLRRGFGDKPVEYPPLPDWVQEEKSDQNDLIMIKCGLSMGNGAGDGVECYG